MSQTNVVPTQKIEDAAAGNKALRDMLTALAATQNQQQQVTSTTGKNVPQQAKATVGFLKGTYTVEIQNPGAVSPVSSVQAALASGGATSATNTQSITPIYHQIRYATSPQFSISSQVTTLGGTTGSTQTFWTLTSLPSGRFYFQIRSSFDGVSWNLWRNANGGQTITNQPEGVTVEDTTNAVFGLFELPGHQLVAFGAGLASNGGTFGVPSQLYTSAMQAIPGLDGFVAQSSNLAHGVVANSISFVGSLQAITGPPDFPTVISQLYEDGEAHQWGGTASIFAFCYDPLGTNVTEEAIGGAVWVDFILPGGAHLSIGTGVTPDGGTIPLPSTMPWVTSASLQTIVSPSVGFNPDVQAHGISDAKIVGTTLSCGFMDGGSTRWGASGNWFAVSISAGYPITAVSNGNWIVINLPSGTKVAIGSGGSVPSGTAFGLPAGFNTTNMLAIATPAGFNDTGHPMSGVFSCGITGSTGNLQYTDTQGNFWNGPYNWMAFAWT